MPDLPSSLGHKSLVPQSSRCPNNQFRQVQDGMLNFGSCKLKPVRNLPTILFRIWSYTRTVDVVGPVQVPQFVVRASDQELRLDIMRAHQDQSRKTTSELLLLANNATSDGGIKGQWLENGLGLTNLSTKCGKPTVCTSQCTTMWLMTQDCAVLNKSHIFANVLSVSDGLAQLQVVAHARALADSTYNFTLFLPTPNNATNQTVAQIEGIFTVSGNPSCSPGSERAPLSFPIGAKQCLKCEPGLYNLGGDVCHVIQHDAACCFVISK